MRINLLLQSNKWIGERPIASLTLRGVSADIMVNYYTLFAQKVGRKIPRAIKVDLSR